MELEHRSSLPEAIPAASPESSPSFLAFDARTASQRKAAELIEQGVEKLLADPGSFFRFASKFHRYSINNQILIMSQFPEATRCASRDRWKALGREVAPDEARNGIEILFPMFRFRTIENPDTGEEETKKTLSGFGVGNTFDISQTEGEPLPSAPTIIEELGVTDGAKDVDRRLSSYLLGEGLRLSRMPLPGARGGYFPPQKAIALAIDLPYGDILTTKTLMHEAAHWAGDHRGGDKQDLETVAEASAFIAMHHAGMDTSEYSFPYVSWWAKDMSRLRQNLGAVQKISTQLITSIERERPDEIGEWV